MNHSKIYTALVERCRIRGRVDGLYGEVHHILPRCLGGGDEPGNLVWMTGREHYVAHLLLAYIHGGKLWFAANFMKRTARRAGVKGSRVYEIVRREFAKAMQSKEKYQIFDTRTQMTFFATLSEIREVHGLSPSEASRLVTGERAYVKGLCVASIAERLYTNPESYEVVEVRTGKAFTGTRKDICDKFCIMALELDELLAGKRKSKHGLRLPKEGHESPSAAHITESQHSSESSQSQLLTPSQPRHIEQESPCAPQAQAA